MFVVYSVSYSHYCVLVVRLLATARRRLGLALIRGTRVEWVGGGGAGARPSGAAGAPVSRPDRGAAKARPPPSGDRKSAAETGASPRSGSTDWRTPL